MLDWLRKQSRSSGYWMGLIAISASMELSALYYQYVKDEWPCVLCIHIRIWLTGVLLIAIISLIFRKQIWLMRISHFLTTLLLAGFTERSYQVLAVERGWVFGDCNMDAGLPEWFALDRWFPWIFEVKTSCGYTPYIVFQISMAEILMATSLIMLASSIALLASSFGTTD
ncbi:MAG: disulfide bond formation protein DsbB [Gammaproteobacteria bacterium]|jgi:disulfide bond formation protein DsbB